MSGGCFLGLLGFWFVVLLCCWVAGLGCWVVGFLGSWRVGLLVCWVAGLLGFWIVVLLCCRDFECRDFEFSYTPIGASRGRCHTNSPIGESTNWETPGEGGGGDGGKCSGCLKSSGQLSQGEGGTVKFAMFQKI